MTDPVNTVRLPKETLTQVSALALPGESLASVIQRAVLALQILENDTQLAEPEPLEQRLAALESRIGRIELCCGAYQASPQREGD